MKSEHVLYVKLNERQRKTLADLSKSVGLPITFIVRRWLDLLGGYAGDMPQLKLDKILKGEGR